MKRHRLSPALVSLATLLLACTATGALAQSSLQARTELEWKDVFKPSVTEEVVEGLCVVRIQGVSGHSAMSIAGTSVTREADAARVHVELALASKGASGKLDIATVLDKTVQRVEFGKGRAVIWRREGSRCPVK